MNFGRLLELLGDEGVFDLATVMQLSGAKRATARVQLHRWCASGKLLALRRGFYAFPEPYGTRRPHPAELANTLLAPSYISRHWALGFFGLIPEHVETYTSVTTRSPRRFENAFGTFRYQHVKTEAFFGYRPYEIDGRRVLLAEPEKALLDLWHFERGQWTVERMEEMRFQNATMIDTTKLWKFARRFNSPRLSVAADTWREVVAADSEGTVDL